MKAIVDVLLEKETLDSAEFDTILQRVNRDKGIEPDQKKPDDSDLPPGESIVLDGGQLIQASSDKEKGDDKGTGGQLTPKFA